MLQNLPKISVLNVSGLLKRSPEQNPQISFPELHLSPFSGLAIEQSGSASSQRQPLRHVLHTIRESAQQRRSNPSRQGGDPGVAEHQSHDVRRHDRSFESDERGAGCDHARRKPHRSSEERIRVRRQRPDDNRLVICTRCTSFRNRFHERFQNW